MNFAKFNKTHPVAASVVNRKLIISLHVGAIIVIYYLATHKEKTPKLRSHCMRVEVDKRYKITSGGARTCAAANI